MGQIQPNNVLGPDNTGVYQGRGQASTETGGGPAFFKNCAFYCLVGGSILAGIAILAFG